jgi:osmotically-inducible protein OsmY
MGRCDTADQELFRSRVGEVNVKSNMQLKADILAELDGEPNVNAAQIGVEVVNGIVTLSGCVASSAEKGAVECAVQRIPGVRGVAVELKIRQPGPGMRTDGEIAQAAREALRWNTLIPHERIRIKVEIGWITLTGTVDWPHQRSHAENSVRQLWGSKGVINLIEISTACYPPL